MFIGAFLAMANIVKSSRLSWRGMREAAAPVGALAREESARRSVYGRGMAPKPTRWLA